MNRALANALTATVRQVAESCPLATRRRLLFLLGHRQLGDFRNPKTFSEKINWRIIHDRRDLIRDTCDKLLAKEQAARLGVAVLPTLWWGTSLEGLVGQSLPPRWVLKPNDGSGQVAFGEGSAPDLGQLRRLTRYWPRRSRPALEGEWAYTKARRLYYVEEMLGEGMATPTSYKFFVFAGEPLYVHAITVLPRQLLEWRETSRDRWPPDDTAMRFYTPAWEPLQVRLADYPLAEPDPPPPALSEMLAAARRLGAPFDFVRVDLMGDGQRFYFGELTPYPHAGLTTFDPREFDRELGSHWTLPRLDEVRDPVARPAEAAAVAPRGEPR